PPGGNPPDNSGNPPDVVTPVFSDIQNHWARQFIEALSAQGMISGFKDGTFKPDDKMTRAQYAALLVKAFNPPAKRQAENFTDVPASFWGYNAIQQAYRGGFVAGFPNKTFKPNDNVQRVQVIVSLVNGLGLAVADANALNAYSDKTAIPDYAKDEVVTASKKRIVVNYPNVKQLNPTKEATRGEVAAMIYQALVDAKRVSAINSDYIVSV
ncbi:MAG TPA: nitrous oxidase accessory protein, partial [Cyanobacteria bacterium UBA11166]|nr:nitrous oxidase accessory protein [Cyanobacteria bacterium UBA11166]